MSAKDLFAAVYVNSPLTSDELTSLLAVALGGVRGRWSLSLDGREIDVRAKDEHDPTVAAGLDAFLYFPYRLDVWAERASVDLAWLVSAVGATMTALASHGATVVTACDWEDQLPGGGRLG